MAFDLRSITSKSDTPLTAQEKVDLIAKETIRNVEEFGKILLAKYNQQKQLIFKNRFKLTAEEALSGLTDAQKAAYILSARYLKSLLNALTPGLIVDEIEEIKP